MKKLNIFSLLIAGSIGCLTFQACTNLEPDEQDSTIVDLTGGGGGTVADPAALLVSAYKDLSAYTAQDHIYALMEHPSDEMIGPTRGTDWGDNGVWRTLHAHTWDASHSFVLSSWNQLNSRIFKCNQILASNPSAAVAAQAKFLRAFNMFNVMDMYGQVPFRNVTDGVDVNPRVFTRAEAFAFIVKDLDEAMPDLPVIGPTAGNNTASKAAANTLLARLYLNKAVYTGSAVDNADMDKVISNCDAVTTAGFSLEPKYFDIFKPGSAKEIILTSLEGSGQNRIHMTLHYDQNPSGWNGFTTLSDFYNKFDAADQRKGQAAAHDGTPFSGVDYGFLVGQQYKDNGTPITNSRNGLPLAFTTNIRIAGAATEDGIRVMKYHAFGPDATAPQYPKYIFFRYGDVVTMKAEAP